MARNPSYVIEIETHLTDIKDQIKKYERDLRGLQDTANNMGIGDSVAKEIQQAIEVLNKLQSEYVESVKKFSNTKLDSSEFDNFTKTIDSRMQQVSGIVVGVEERISELSNKIDNFKMDKLISQVKGVRNQMSSFRKDMKGAVDLLKEFQNLTSQYSGEKELRSLLTTLDKIGQVDLTDLKGVSATKKQLKSLEAQLDETYSRFTMFKETLSDKNSSPTMIKNAEKEMANLIPEISEIIKKIATINGIDPINFEQFFTGLEIKTAGSPLDVDEILKEIDSDFEIIQQRLKSRRDELQSEVEKFKTGTTEVNTFTFEDGGIKVPVVLSQESINKCKEDLNELVAILQRDTKPVEVFIKLSALKTEKLNSSELSKYIKDIKAQIPKDASDELKTSVNKLVKNFDHEYQNSLKLNIKFNLSDSVESAEKKVKLITDRIKKLRPTISPIFDIDPEEVKKINSKFDDIRGEFKFDLTGQLTDLTEQLNKLLNESDPSKWSESFKRGLNNLKPTIEELSTLVQPLVQLTSKGKNKVGRPSKQDLEDRSYVEKFTSAINSLNKALSIYDKKLKYSGSIASELTDGVQGEIDKSGEYVTVPVRPDVNGFMDELEESLNDLKINVSLGNVTSDGTTTESSGTVTASTTSKSKTKKSDDTTAETKPKSKYLSKDTDGMDDEFKNVFFGGKTKKGKNKKINLGTKEEKEAIKEINSAMNSYLYTLENIEKKQKSIEKLDPLNDPENAETIQKRINDTEKYLANASKKIQDLEDKYPMLKNISGKKNLTHYEKDNIRDEYLSSKGIKRTAQYHESSYFDSLRDEVSKKGKFNLKESGNKEALTDIVSRYLGYKNRGGTRTLDDLTDNSAVLQKLRKKYDELTGSVSRTTKAKNEYTNATGKETSSNIYEQQSTAQLKQKYEELTNYKKTLNEQLGNTDYLKGVGQAKEEIQQETTSLSNILKAYQNNKKIYNKKKKDNAEDAEEFKKSLIESTENNLKDKYALTSDDLKGFSKFSSKKIDELSQELVGRRQVLKELSKTENQMNTISSILDNRKNSTDDISKETSEIKENTKAKQTNNDETKKQKQTKTNKQSDVEEIKQETTALKENTKAKESNNKVELTQRQKTDAKKMLSKSNKKQSQIKKNNETIQRETAFNSLRNIVSSLDSFDLRKNGMEHNLDLAVKQYQEYVNQGGKRPITDLTDNEKAQKKLKEAYEKTTAAIKEQTSEKNKNNKPVVEEIQEEVNVRQKNVSAAKEETDAVNKSNQAKKELSIDEQIEQSNQRKITDAQSFKSSNKKYSKLSDEYVAYNERSDKTYDTESMDSMLKKRAEAVKIKNQIVKFSKENIDNITDSDIEKLDNLNSKYGEIVKGLSNVDYTSIVDLEDINSEYNKAFDIIYDKIEENSKKQGESYAEGIESTKSQAEQAGADLANAANEGTADAQQSHSPSKVAEALGEYWGIGYAKGIKKHKGDVEDAVKELVSTGVLTTENLQEDFTKLTNGEYGNKYKALYEPLNNILNVDDTDAKKIITSAKGQITKITNQLSNIDNIEDLDKADSNINKWLNKLEELGYDTSTFEKKYVLARKEIGKTFGSAFTRITSETKASVQDLQQESEKTADLIERLGGVVDVYRQVQKKSTKTGYENAISYRLVGENGYAWVGANGDILKENIQKSSSYTDSVKSQKEQLKERQKNEQLALQYHLQALEKESAAEREAYNNKMAIRQEWLKNAQEETARRASEPTFKDNWDESLSKINKEQHKTLQNIFKEQFQTTSKDAFKNYHDKDGNWTGALADEALAEAEERQKVIDERNANYEKVLSTYKELLSAQKELNTLTKRNEETSGIYADDLKECESTVQRLRGEINSINESGMMDSFSDEQTQKLSSVAKNIKDAENAQTAYKQIEDSKQAYEELGSKVKEYIKLRKIIAQGKALDGDVDKAEKLKSEIDELNNSLNESPLFNASRQTKAMSGMDTIDEEVNRINQAQQERLSKTFQGISSRLDSASYDVGFEIQNGNQTEEFKQRLISIKQQIDDINNKPINAITQSDIDEGTRLLEQVRQIRKEGKLTENTKANENSVQKGLAQINSILSENTKLSFKNTDVYKDLVNLKKEFQTFDTNRPQAELAELTTSFLKVKARFEDLENTFKGKNLFQTFVERLHGTTAQLIAQYLSFQDIIRYARTIVSTIIDLDAQLVDLRKTTKMNTDELNNFYSSASNVSKQLGVTTSEIISQAAAWSRLGYNTKEASTEMAKLSSQFASISPGMDTESATDTLVSTMQAYKIGVDDVQRTVMDNINAIGNSMATTNEEIGEMLQRSSAAMKAANNSLEETIALESAAVEITRNAETTGTAFRTISMRIRGYDEETEELSNDLENISGDIYDLTKVNGKGISIFTDKTRTEYKSTYEILKEISGVWDELTDKQQADLLEKLGGKRGAQSLAGILADFSSVEEAMETMENAAGSSDREMDIIRDSLEFKLNALKQTWVGTLTEITDRGDIGAFIDMLTKLSEGLGDVASNIGIVKTAVIGISTVIGSQKLGLLKLLKGDFSGLEKLKNQIVNLSQAGQSLKNLNTSINNINKIPQDIFTANGINTTSIDLYRKSLEGLTIEQKALALSTSSLTEAEIKEMLTRQDNAIATNAISESEAEVIISKMGLITTTQLLSETELEELSTRVGLEAQTIKNALIETGLVTVKNGDVITTKELTEAELEEALTSEGAALADKKQTAQIIAETIAKKTNIGITQQYAGNTNLLIGAFDKLKTVIATHPILTFATILGAGIYAIKKYKDSIDSLIESGKNITSEYESKVNDLHKNQSEFSTLATRYSELSDGVNSLGQNVSLTSDEFSEYKDIVNKIGDLSPNLIKGYSDEGDAILKIKDNVEALTEAYNQNIIAANNSILSDARTVTEAANKSEVKYNAKDSSKYQVEGLEGLLNGTLSASDVMSRYRDAYSGGLYGYEYKDLTELLNSLGIDVGFTKDDEFWTSESEANEFNKKLETTLNNLNSDQRNILQGYITRRNSEYEEIFKGSRDVLKANIENAILTDNDLQNLPEELKTTLLNISDSLDVEIFKKYNSPEELAQYASTITDAFKTLSSTQQEDIEMGINLSTQWNNDELSYDDYIAKVQEFVNLLETLFPDNKEIVESFKILFDIPDEEELAKQQDVFVNRLGEKAVSSKNVSTATSGVSKAGMPSDVENRLKSQGTEVADAWYDSLKKSQREFVDNVSDEDLAEAVRFDSTQEFDEWLEKLQEEANENEIEVKTKYSESVATLDSMEDSFGDNLSTLYTTTVTNGDKASGSEIEDVNSDFGGVTFDEEDISNVNTMSNAIERFNQDLIENAGDSEAAQTSMNKLATAYVDQSGVLDGLLDNLDDITDAEKDYYIQQLKASGITNAEEVVNSRLSKQYQKTSKALTELSKNIAQNRSALDKGIEAGEEYDTAIENIKSSVTDLLTTYDENGDATFIPEVDSSFITSNLEDIYAATEGDIDALNRLRLEVARLNASKAMVEIDLPSDVVSANLDKLMDKVEQVDAMDIEVGASVDDTAFLMSLQNMINNGQVTADAVSSAFESMGYNVEWIPHTYKVSYVKAHETEIKDSKAYNTMLEKAEETIDMPSLKITRASSSSGASVNYGGGTSSSSSSSGGSDSDSDSDSSEDTFDWVEVAISRLESEIERLDEIVDNTYETWGKRNEALKNQIEDITDEIELQSVAAQRYLAEANSVGLSDEYKKKVQEGTIDIETITDEDLAEDINDYQTYWENYQDAMDQIQTLTFELQGYYKELFEQIESEYDDLLTNIEKKTDIIEEYITRTEEHGYFVDRKYYDDELKLEKQNNDELIKERERLVKTMNLAISEGKIKSGSEAWNDMYQSIMDVNKAIEESYTNTVKLNNAIRQLEWDAFDWIEDRISDISAEADFLIGLLQGELNYEDNGQFNNRGFAQAGLVGAKYDETLAKAQRYKDEILEVNKLLANDKNDKELIARKEELVQAYRDVISAAEDEKQAMKSLVEEAFNKNLESLQKLIDKYKEAMQSAKD